MNWIHFNDNDDNDGVEGRWAYVTDDHIAFFIFGTNHFIDWIRNILIKKLRYDGVRVNRHDLYEAQWCVEYMTNHIDMSKIRKITVGGHSRGGATAAVVVLKLLKKFPDKEIQGVLTAPKKTGNKALITRTEEHIQSFRHHGDFVPLLPPYIPFFYPYRNYKHNTFGKWTYKFVTAHRLKSYNWVLDKYNLR